MPFFTTDCASVTALQWIDENRLIIAGPESMHLYDTAGRMLAHTNMGARRLDWLPGASFVRFLPFQFSEVSTPRDWDWVTGNLSEPVTGVYHTCCGVFTPDGHYLHGGELYDGGYWCCQTPAGALKKGSDSLRMLLDMALSPDGARFLAGGRWSYLAVWDWEKHQGEPELLLEPGGVVTAVAWAAGGRYVAAGIAFGKVRVWATENYQLEADITLKPLHRGNDGLPITRIRFMPGADHLLWVQKPHSLQLFNWTTGECLYDKPGSAFDLSPHNRLLARAEGNVIQLELIND